MNYAKVSWFYRRVWFCVVVSSGGRRLDDRIRGVFGRCIRPKLCVYSLTANKKGSCAVNGLAYRFCPGRFRHVVVLYIRGGLVRNVGHRVRGFVSRRKKLGDSRGLIVRGGLRIVLGTMGSDDLRRLLSRVSCRVNRRGEGGLIMAILRSGELRIRGCTHSVHTLIGVLRSSARGTSILRRVRGRRDQLECTIESFFTTCGGRLLFANRIGGINIEAVLDHFASLIGMCPRIDCTNGEMLLVAMRGTVCNVSPVLSRNVKVGSFYGGGALVLFSRSSRTTITVYSIVVRRTYEGSTKFGGCNGNCRNCLRCLSLLSNGSAISSECSNNLLGKDLRGTRGVYLSG